MRGSDEPLGKDENRIRSTAGLGATGCCCLRAEHSSSEKCWSYKRCNDKACPKTIHGPCGPNVIIAQRFPEFVHGIEGRMHEGRNKPDNRTVVPTMIDTVGGQKPPSYRSQ